jgi:hypothetical protein
MPSTFQIDGSDICELGVDYIRNANKKRAKFCLLIKKKRDAILGGLDITQPTPCTPVNQGFELITYLKQHCVCTLCE